MGWPPDISIPRAILIAVGVTLVVAVVVAASTSATAFSLYNTGWEGSAELRSVTQDAGATYRIGESTQIYERVVATQTIGVILAPAEPYSAEDRQRLRAFLADGGTLVVAGDFGSTPNQLLAALGARARVRGEVLRDERNHYRGPALPIADNVTDSALTAGIDQLTLNYASPVRPNGATVLVRTSSFAYVDANENQALDDTEVMRAYPVVTEESVGAGTVVVVGDPSVFINVMLEQPDNRAWVHTLASTHATVVLDTSHSAAIPPLAGAVLAIRDTLVLQLVLVVIGGGVVVGVSDRRVREWVQEWLEEDRTNPSLSQEAVTQVVRERHPDWDPDRVQRVVEGLIRQRGEEEDDD